MNKGVALILGLACLLVAGIVYLKHRNDPAPAAAAEGAPAGAEYAWTTVWDRRMGVLNGFETFKVPTAKKVRFKFSTKYPVTLGLVREQRLDRAKIAQLDFGELSCSEGSTAEVERECDVPNSPSLLVIQWDGKISPGATANSQDANLKIEAFTCTANCK